MSDPNVPVPKSAEEELWELKTLASIKAQIDIQERAGQLTKSKLIGMLAQSIMEYQKLRLIMAEGQKQKEATYVAV